MIYFVFKLSTLEISMTNFSSWPCQHAWFFVVFLEYVTTEGTSFVFAVVYILSKTLTSHSSVRTTWKCREMYFFAGKIHLTVEGERTFSFSCRTSFVFVVFLLFLLLLSFQRRLFTLLKWFEKTKTNVNFTKISKKERKSISGISVCNFPFYHNSLVK